MYQTFCDNRRNGTANDVSILHHCNLDNGPPIRIDGAHFHLLEPARYPEHNEDHAIRTQRILLVQTTSHPNIVKPDAQRPISFLFIFLYTKYQQNGRPCRLRAAGPDRSCAHIPSKICTPNFRRGSGSQPRAIKLSNKNHCPSLQTDVKHNFASSLCTVKSLFAFLFALEFIPQRCITFFTSSAGNECNTEESSPFSASNRVHSTSKNVLQNFWCKA